jgi:release factor glutamine methyltransferase
MTAAASHGLEGGELELFERIRGQIASALETLPDKPEETPDSTLRCLWHLASGMRLSPDKSLEVQLPHLDAKMQEQLQRLVAQRMSGIPLAHLSGRQRFMGLELLASPQALIPRRETELLAQAAVDTLRDQILNGQGHAAVMDACTGCGNVAVAMAHSDPRVKVYAADLSEEAVDLARANVEHLGLQAQVELRTGDLLAPFDEAAFHRQVDLITCNPPYISTKKMETMADEIIGHEPRLAFDGGALGVRILQRLIRDAPQLLRSGGWLLFEVGLGQGPAVMQRMAGTGDYDEMRGVTDREGQIRSVIARRR